MVVRGLFLDHLEVSWPHEELSLKLKQEITVDTLRETKTDPQKQHDTEKYVVKQELKKTEEPKINNTKDRKKNWIMDSTKTMMDIFVWFFSHTKLNNQFKKYYFKIKF